MQDIIDYAKKHGIVLEESGPCQFCGSKATRGVFECHENAHHVAELLDFNDAANYLTRFLSVDAMALQHTEVHGLWSNHLHLTRLFLIFEKKVPWTYAKTPQLSGVINHYKKHRTEFLVPPPPKQRGEVTTSDLLLVSGPEECHAIVRKWAWSVFQSYRMHHELVSDIADIFVGKYP